MNNQNKPRATGQVAHRLGANTFADFYACPSPAKAIALVLSDYQERALPANPPSELWIELVKARDICNSYADNQARIKALEEALSPFAALDISAMESLGKKTMHPIFGINYTLFTIGDVQRARAALALATEGSK